MGLSELNTNSFRAINNLTQELTFLNPIMIFLTEYGLYLLATIVIIFLFTKNRRDKFMVLSSLLAIIISLLLGKIVGTFHSNLQPFAELADAHQLIPDASVDNSFPSDTTAMFFAVVVTFALFRKPYKWLWFIVPIIIGLARIWTGVHYPGDVFVGTFIGIVAAFLSFFIVKSVFQRQLEDVPQHHK